MNLPRRHLLVLSLAIGLAVAVGAVALSRTAGIATSGTATAAASTGVSRAAFAAKSRQLDALERSLDRRLAAARRPVERPAPRFVTHYVRPPAHVVTVARHHGDDEGFEHGESGDD